MTVKCYNRRNMVQRCHSVTHDRNTWYKSVTNEPKMLQNSYKVLAMTVK